MDVWPKAQTTTTQQQRRTMDSALQWLHHPGACNFDATANSNDGTCDFAACVGCMDPTACNYDGRLASRVLQLPCRALRLRRQLLVDDCSDFIVEGCTDACACNYDPFANTANGTCEFSSCGGCIYPTAENYDPVASRDDGSCMFVGCTNAAYASYSAQANTMDNTLCTNTPASADLNADGTVQIEDLMQFLQAFAAVTPEWNGVGWVASACNVDALNADEMLASLVAASVLDRQTQPVGCLVAATQGR